MKIKTQDLTDAALDWAVDEIEYKRMQAEGEYVKGWVLASHRKGESVNPWSSDWLWGGPIIEREEIAVQCCYCDGELVGWMADSKKLNEDDDMEQYGSTPLIAAMRCYVATKLGDGVDVPEELIS